MSSPVPIVVFAYNRPKHLQITLAALTRCRRLEECQVFIYCDGPKNPENLKKVNQTRKVAKKWAELHHANVVLREKNIGLKASIIAGVTQACEDFGRVIVIEDDIVVSPAFISFMLEALDQYKDSLNIYEVAGFLYSPERLSKEDAFLFPVTSSWGWATWQRVWGGCDFEIKQAPISLKDEAFRKRFDLDGTYPWSLMLEDEFYKHIDTWDIQWYYHVFMHKGLVVYPAHTLVYNNGFDSTGIHCGNLNVNPIKAADLKDLGEQDKFVFPSDLVVNNEIFQKYKLCIHSTFQKGNQEPLFIILKRKTIILLTKMGLYKITKRVFEGFKQKY